MILPGFRLRALAAAALAPLLLATMGAAVVAGHDDLRPVDLVVTRHIAARGGLAAMTRIRSARLFGRLLLGPGSAGRATITLARDPDRIRSEIAFGPRLFVQAYDGSVAWASNPFGGDTVAAPLARDEARNVAAGADMDGPLVNWLDKGNLLSEPSPDTADGRRAWRIDVTTADSLHDRYWIDALSLMQTKWEGARTQAGRPVVFVSYFRDWREVGGVKWAFRIDSETRGRPGGQHFAFDSVLVNVAITPESFALPPRPAKR